jgi:hypothetical protein
MKVLAPLGVQGAALCLHHPCVSPSPPVLSMQIVMVLVHTRTNHPCFFCVPLCVVRRKCDTMLYSATGAGGRRGGGGVAGPASSANVVWGPQL